MVTTRFATPNRTETKTAVNWRTNETHSIRSSVEFIGTGTREEGRRLLGEIIRGYEDAHVSYRGCHRSTRGQVFDHHRGGTARKATDYCGARRSTSQEHC